MMNDDLDDHFVVETALREVLPLGTLTAFENCTRMLIQLNDHTPDHLFLDIIMKEITGINVLMDYKETKNFAGLLSSCLRPPHMCWTLQKVMTLELLYTWSSHPPIKNWCRHFTGCLKRTGMS